MQREEAHFTDMRERHPEMLLEPEDKDAYRRALQDGYRQVYRTRLMVVGQESVGKTSLIRNLTHQSFNRNEPSTTGIDASKTCEIDIKQAKAWQLSDKGSDTLESDLVKGVAAEIKSPSAETAERRSAERRWRVHSKIPPKRQRKIGQLLLSAGDGEEPIHLYIWDFAGQDLFYTTHQTFLSSRALYVVVFNLQKFDEPTCDDDVSATGTDTQGHSSYRMTPRQYLDFWMRSIYTYTVSKEGDKANLKQDSPPIFLVGTHRNNLGENKEDCEKRAKAILDRIRKEIEGKPYEKHVVTKFMALDNSEGSESDEISELRTRIENTARNEPYMGEKIPLRWMEFDDKKTDELDKGGDNGDNVPIWTLEKVQNTFGEGKQDERELLTMLNFYHDLGHIIYFGGDDDQMGSVLRDTIILDPQWLIDIFKRVITTIAAEDRNATDGPRWRRLENEGILEDELLKKMWSGLKEEWHDACLALMEKFDLLCPRHVRQKQNTGEVSYYVPSMLRRLPASRDESGDDQTNSSVFFVDFKGFLPDGLFHRLVVRLLRESQERGGKDARLRYDSARFFYDNDHECALELVRQENLALIKVRVIRALEIPLAAGSHTKDKDELPLPKVTKAILDFVTKELDDLRKLWIKGITFFFCVQCPCQRGSCHFLRLDDCLENEKVPCNEGGRKLMTILTKAIQDRFKPEGTAIEKPTTRELEENPDREYPDSPQ